MVQQFIHLKFKTPVNGKTDYFYGSLKAIFSEFSPAQVGCTLRQLFEARAATVGRYENDKCIIQRAELLRQPQSNK